MKAYVAMIAPNLKALCSEAAPDFSRNSEKFGKLQGKGSKRIFNKISGM